MLKAVVDGVKELVFAETEDAGKLSQILWTDDTSGTATIHAPIAAFDRFAKRAAMRALRIKVPGVASIEILKVWPQVVRLTEGTYYLVRVSFKM